MHRILPCRVNYSDHISRLQRRPLFPQEQSEGVPNSSLTVRKAREIFEQFVSSDSLVLKKSRVEKPGLCPGDFTPIWDKANESADSLIECVDVPISTQFLYRGTFVSKEPSKKGETERYATDIFQKLLVVYDKRSRLTGCFIINLIPTKQYYNKHKNDIALAFCELRKRLLRYRSILVS